MPSSKLICCIALSFGREFVDEVRLIMPHRTFCAPQNEARLEMEVDI